MKFSEISPKRHLVIFGEVSPCESAQRDLYTDSLQIRCQKLDLRFLLRQAGLKTFLLPRCGCCQLLHFFVLFEKFIEQHRVYLRVESSTIYFL